MQGRERTIYDDVNDEASYPENWSYDYEPNPQDPDKFISGDPEDEEEEEE